MGIKATVKPYGVTGTHRGGEDLFLVFDAVESDTVEGVSLKPENDLLKWNRDEAGNYWCKTNHCEHKWIGTLQDLLDLFVKVGGSDRTRWSWYGNVSQPPKKRFTYEYFVKGDAD